MNAPETKRTQQEIEDLKAQWLADPCWDIYTTEGFQYHYDELYTFQEKTETENRQKEQNRIDEKCARLGISFEMLQYIESLEAQINKLQEAAQ